MEIEDALDLSLDQSYFEGCKTVGDVAKVVEDEVWKKNRGV